MVFFYQIGRPPRSTLSDSLFPYATLFRSALDWPAAATLVVADLHLEKGSAFARRGQLLPPYDSRATLAALAAAVARHHPRRVVCLGDSFHDDTAAARLGMRETGLLRNMAQAHDWIWVAGNHDPAPPVDRKSVV